MVTSQNLRAGTKRPVIDDDNSPKRAIKVTKKAAPKRASFVPKPQIPVSSQDVSQLSFATLVSRSSSVATPSKKPSKEQSEFSCLQAQPSDEIEPFELEPCSPILPQRRQKAAFSNQRLPTNKTWEIFGDQDLTDYLSSTNNMVEYKNGCWYFYACLALIAHGCSINELKNIFNATLPQFLEDDKEYNQKTACRTFEDKYDWVIDRLIERIHAYAQLWIDFFGGSDYKAKYLHVK